MPILLGLHRPLSLEEIISVNRFAYYMSGYAFKAFSGISKARITIHNREKIPKGALIFTANHFTRIETVFLPYHIHEITKHPVWSLAAAELFQGSLKGILEAMGGVSTRDPQRDFLIVKSLLGGKAECIIFPEGMMVKNKKITRDGELMLYEDGKIQRPHTGAAILALTTAFYRERLRRMEKINPTEFDRLVTLYELDDLHRTLSEETFIVPVNLTYYPVRAKENMLSKMALNMLENPSQRVTDELLTEGTMLFSGVDVDIRFGDPIPIRPYLFDGFVESDLTTRRPISFSNRMSSHHVMKQNARGIMEKYMRSVYSMTTLNHDHIFASILKYMPQSPEEAIDPFDFRCRAYLATFACAMSLYCNFHRNLYENQIHLLTNDRFNKFAEFLELGRETGVLEIKDGKIYKNHERLEAPSVFHTVRIDNPVSVIANEVEPLTQLQALLSDLAVKSPADIIQLLVYRIEDRQFTQYVEDFKRFAAPLMMLEGSVDTADSVEPINCIDSIDAVDVIAAPASLMMEPMVSSTAVQLTSPIKAELTEAHREFCTLHPNVASRKAVFDNGRPQLLEPETVYIPSTYSTSRDPVEGGATGSAFVNNVSGINSQSLHPQKGIGILLIHDYLSSPGEMLHCGRYFQSKGFIVYLPRLPGHGTAPDNLSDVTFTQWMEAVEEGAVLLGGLCSMIVVGGVGIGGVLGLALQSVVKGIDAFFMISPPTRIKDYPDEFFPSRGLWNQMIKRSKRHAGEKEGFVTCFWDNNTDGASSASVSDGATNLFNPEGLQVNESELDQWGIPEMGVMRYFRYPVSALKQVELLLEQMDSDIKSWEKQEGFPPLLVILPRKNPFVDLAASQKLFDRIPAAFKELYLFHEDRHGILSGGGSRRVHEAIWGFIHSALDGKVS